MERPIRYLRDNFLYGRTFLGDADLADQGARWLSDVANPRIHGTTKEPPILRWQRDERAVLQPLAARPYRSLVLLPESPAARVSPRVAVPQIAVPQVAVERRALAHYDSLLAEVGT